MSQSSNTKQGESHRIYWQQWISQSANGGDVNISPERKSRRELITSSAAVRISHTGASARDVTNLLRHALNLGDDSSETVSLSPYSTPEERDSLVLVGTLYSLPKDYVKFEHELGGKIDQPASEHADGFVATTTPTYSKSDPYHIVKTLHSNDDPLQVRRCMEDQLRQLQEAAPATRTIISPKLQWYFVPSALETHSNIPNCVELDGYCTSLEKEDSDDDDDDEKGEEEDDVGDSDECDDSESQQALGATDVDEEILSRFPWLPKPDSSSSSAENVDRKTRHKSERSLRREERRFRQLSRSQTALRNHCVSGYLLKRSRKDPHVWRRVHCVLTDDFLWYVSRIYQDEKTTHRFAKHGRIRLTRALLLEPSADYVPLFRTPFAFELVTGRGTSHWFRASNKQLQKSWVRALSERIVQAFENSLIDQAELIVADECLARNRRMDHQAVEPFWKSLTEEEYNSDRTYTAQGHVGAVLRWGMQVASYRECCRHIQSSLPAKSPVVVRTPRRPSHGSSSRTRNNKVHPEPIDPAVQDMIQATWAKGAELLARATHVALQIQPKLSHSIETQCRHVDYVLHGRFRSNSVELNEAASPLGEEDLNPHVDPPPMDLFDPLLSELQSLAARAAHNFKKGGVALMKINGESRD